MSGICGWLSGRAHDAPADLLAGMASGLPNVGDLETRSRWTATCGLHIETAEQACHFNVDGPVWAALEGYPRWLSADLSDMAARDGHGKALAVAYERHGKELFDVLLGPWALVVVDPTRNRALVAVDRLGVRPMCHARTRSGGIVVGSTTDSVRRHPGVTASISYQAIFDYVFFTRTPAPETIYGEISKLLPAQYLWFDDGQSEVGRYWRLNYEESDSSGVDVDGLAAELRDVLERAFARAVEGRDMATVGTFLSGGVDSSTVTGLLAERAPGQAKAFSVGFDVEGYDEMAYARTAASHFGAVHRAYYVTAQDVVDVAPKIAEIYDEPYGNSSAVPAYYCARFARENGAGLLLAGDGGDELFAGNARYATQKKFEAYARIPGWLRRFVFEPVIFGFPGAGALAPIEKAQNFIRKARLPLPDRLEVRNYYLGVPAERCFQADLSAAVDPNRPLTLLRAHFHGSAAASTLNRMMHLDLRFVLADDDLRKVGRTSELAGASVRYPLLDEEVVEFSARVPANLKLKGRQLRYFFKYAMHDFLPRSSLTKRKQGFGLPFGPWLRTHHPLRELAYDNIEALKRRDIFLPTFLEAVVAESRTGTRDVDEPIWVLMMLELWLGLHAANPRVRDRPSGQSPSC
jgi:asparagine synthase (glutamine-hydrolysing)